MSTRVPILLALFSLLVAPSVAEDLSDVEEIVREVRKANELRKVVLHTIALGPFQKSFMKRLAEENGGVFVDLGK